MGRFDLSDEEWELVVPQIPVTTGRGGRMRDARRVLNGMFHVLRSGTIWRDLPERYGPWQTVYYYLRRWQHEGVWGRVHHALVMADRERTGREPSPSAAILDSQSVRTADQKGDQRVTTPARRSRGASVTS